MKNLGPVTSALVIAFGTAANLRVGYGSMMISTPLRRQVFRNQCPG